jgi:hypothetical protein
MELSSLIRILVIYLYNEYECVESAILVVVVMYVQVIVIITMKTFEYMYVQIIERLWVLRVETVSVD